MSGRTVSVQIEILERRLLLNAAAATTQNPSNRAVGGASLHAMRIPAVSAAVPASPQLPSTRLLPFTENQNTIYDPLRQRVYEITSKGNVERYDLASSTLLPSISLIPAGSGTLGVGDITPDGRLLYVPLQTAVNGQGVIFKVDLSSASVSRVTFAIPSDHSGPLSLKIGSNGKGLISLAGSSPPWVWEIDTTTDLITTRNDLPPSSHYYSGGFAIERSEDRSTLVLLQVGISDGFYFTYDAQKDSFGATGLTQTYNDTQSAVSPDGSLIAYPGYPGLDIVDQDLHLVKELSISSVGLAFDPIRKELYDVTGSSGFYDPTLLDVYNTQDWSLQTSLKVPAPFGPVRNITASDDGKYLFLQASDGLRVLSISDAPTADLGGPYSTKEGAPLTLSAAHSYGVQHPIVSYEWDFNYDGTNFNVDATGVTAAFPTATVDGPTTRTVALRVTDVAGNTAIATTTVTVADVPPATAISGPAGSWTGSPYDLTLSGSDPGSDPVQSWEINWGDGSPPQIFPGSSEVAAHVYQTDSGASGYSITATATTADGSFAARPLSVNIYPAPTLELDGTLVVNDLPIGMSDVELSSSNGVLVIDRHGPGPVAAFDSTRIKAIDLTTSSRFASVLLGSNLPATTIHTGPGRNGITVVPGAVADAPLTVLGGSGPTVVAIQSATANLHYVGGSGIASLMIGVTGITKKSTSTEINVTSSTLQMMAPDAGVNIAVDYSNLALLAANSPTDNATFNINVPSGPRLYLAGNNGFGNTVFNVTAAPASPTADLIGGGGRNTFFIRDGVAENISAPNGPNYAVADPTDTFNSLVPGQFIVTGGDLSGTVYEDLNGNRHRDPGEPGLPNATVFVDEKRTGRFAPGDPTTTTDANGNYHFANAQLLGNLYRGYLGVGVVPTAGLIGPLTSMRFPSPAGTTGADLPMLPPPTLLSAVIGDGTPQRSIISQITLTFSQPVFLTQSSVTLDRRNSGGSGANDNSPPTDLSGYLAISQGSSDATTWIVTTRPGSPDADPISGGFSDGIYDFTLHASLVGTWQPMPADVSFTFHRLFGDVLGSKTVDNVSYARFFAAFGKQKGEPGYDPAFDYYGTGIIDAAVYLQFRKRFGHSFIY